MEEPRQPRVEARIPDALEPGVYANVFSIGHTPHEFTLDFGVLQPAEPDPEYPDRLVQPWRVVARVRIAPTVIFDVLRAVNVNMTRYESAFGSIQYPRRPDDPAA